MSLLTDRFPTTSNGVHTEGLGAPATRPFGLDALTNSHPYDPAQHPTPSLDADSQLSTLDGEVCLDTVIGMAGTACGTDSDGTRVAKDLDQHDDW